MRLESGAELRIGYADQNGHAYHSIGRYLVEKGELSLGEASMQGIQAWARANPARLAELLNQNPSFVFFRELPPSRGPRRRSDRRARRPSPQSARSRSIRASFRSARRCGWRRLVRTRRRPSNVSTLAQDTGGAIRGAVRADFFWGTGPAAGALAGRMRQQGRMWVLLPKEMPLPRQP